LNLLCLFALIQNHFQFHEILIYFYERCVGGPKSADFYPTIKPFLTNKGSNITKDIILEDNNKIINNQLHLSKELFFLNSGTTWASFIFSGKMELFIDLFIKFVIGLTIAGFANFRSFAEMPSRPVAFFEFALFICFMQL
jgi:hypothetical protein